MYKINGSLPVPCSVPPSRQLGPGLWRCRLLKASPTLPGPSPVAQPRVRPLHADSDFPVSLPVMTVALPGAQTRSPPRTRHSPQTQTSEVCRNFLSVSLEPLESHRQGVGSCSYEKYCSVSGLKRHVRAEDKDPQLQVRLIYKANPETYSPLPFHQ